MAFSEDLSVFLADFGQACTLAGVPVTAIMDTVSFEDPETGVISEGPSALLTSAQAGAATNRPFTAGGVSYTVRRVLRQPPDGAFTRLVLARL